MTQLSEPRTAAEEQPSAGHPPGPGTQAKADFVKKQEFEDLKKQAFQKAFQEGFAQGEQQGHEEGYASGLEAGMKDAETTINQQVKEAASSLVEMTGDFKANLQNLDEVVIAQLTAISVTIAKQLAHRAIDIDPNGLNNEIQALLHEYPDLIGTPMLWISEVDAQKLGSLTAEIESAGWKIHIDSSISPGGCKLTSKQTEVDLSVETRLAQLAERLVSIG